jgi:hypothetical protein
MLEHKKKGRKQHITDIEIINDLRTVAKKLRKNTLTIRYYCKKNGAKYSYETTKIRFGSWNTVLKKAGLEIKTGNKKVISDAEIINNFRAIAKKLKKRTLTVTDYCKENGAKCGYGTVKRRFGGWAAALKVFGLELKADYKMCITESEVVNDLQAVAKKLGQNSLRIRHYSKKNGAKYTYPMVRSLVGSWNTALEKAGLETKMPPDPKIKKRHTLEHPQLLESLLEDIINVSKERKNLYLLKREYEKYGKYNTATIRKRFGIWREIMRKARLQNKQSTEEYMQNLLKVWDYYGKPPKFTEVKKPFSKYNAPSYIYRYGSWKNAIKAVVEYRNTMNSE